MFLNNLIGWAVVSYFHKKSSKVPEMNQVIPNRRINVETKKFATKHFMSTPVQQESLPNQSTPKPLMGGKILEVSKETNKHILGSGDYVF